MVKDRLLTNCDIGAPCRCTKCREKNRMIKHFGVNLKPRKEGLRLTRDNYITSVKRKLLKEIENGTGYYSLSYTVENIERDMEDILVNFDRYLRYWDSLESDRFNTCVDSVISKFNLIKVEDLNLFSGKTGNYMLVMDQYKKVYVGKADDIKERVRTHWRAPSLDSIHYGTSLEPMEISKSHFKPLDTTRIYAIIYEGNDVAKQSYINECLMIDEVPIEFSLNVTDGGVLGTDMIVESSRDRARERLKERESLLNY